MCYTSHKKHILSCFIVTMILTFLCRFALDRIVRTMTKNAMRGMKAV